MDKIEKIIELYYLKHLKQNEIAKILDVSTQYISKIVKKDNRYVEEKENRKKMNAENRKEYLKNYFKTYVRQKDDAISKEELKIIHDRDAKQLSYFNQISDIAFARWNMSAYHVNKNGNLTLVNNLNVSKDVPKIIYRNAKVRPQKYKGNCCFNH